jgi:hypothetical protein
MLTKRFTREGWAVSTVNGSPAPEHPHKHYSDGGWDEVVEAWTDKEIWEVIAGAETPERAIAKMTDVVKMRHDRAEDVRSTAW